LREEGEKEERRGIEGREEGNTLTRPSEKYEGVQRE
jgi:hypothetical protein